VPCTVVAIEDGARAEIRAHARVGATLVPVRMRSAWQALDDRSYPGVSGNVYSPFDDQNFHRRSRDDGPEILEDAPDTAASCSDRRWRVDHGIVSAVKALRSRVKVWGARAGSRRARGALVRGQGSAQEFPVLESHVVDARAARRVSADVATDAAGCGTATSW